MTRSTRFAWLSLLAALAAPALLILPRSAHSFDAGPSYGLPFFSFLAAALAWRAQGAPLRKVWAWGLALLALAWALFGLDSFRAVQNLTRYDPSPLLTPLFRATLALGALLLAWQAAQAPLSARLPALGQRVALGLAAWLFASGAQSLRPDLSLQTLLLWSSYAFVALAAWMLAETPAARRRLAALVLWVGLINVAYAIVQALGQDPMPWNKGFNGRAMGFLGNPNFLGGHLALLLPLALALALDARGSARAQSGRWIMAALLAVGLLLSQTRGAWAGAALGLGLLAWLLARRASGLLTRQRRPLLTGLILFGVFGGLYIGVQPVARARFVRLLTGKDAEASRRAFLFRKSFQLAARYPLLGVGPGNFRILFPSVQVQGLDPQSYDQQPFVLSEHSHNDLLQMAADAGFLAALAWLALLLLVGRQLWKAGADPASAARREPEALLVLGVLAGLVALNVHGLANFPFLILPTQATAWALAAIALRAVSTDPVSDEGLVDASAVEGPATRDPRPTGYRLKPLVSLSLIGFIALALAIRAARGLQGEGFWWMGEGELGLGNHDVASPVLLRALDYDRREDRLWCLHGRAEFEKGLIWNSIGSFREARRLDPFDAESGVRLGKALVENNVRPEAIEVMQAVARYAPNYVDVWEPLAAALYQEGKFAEAVQAYDWMLYYKVNEEAAYANKAACLGNLGQLPQALLTLKAAELKLPDNGKIQMNIAITYLKLGMKPQAREAWRNAKRLSPSDPQVDQLSKLFR
jgi:O-antigen ligase/Tfp pilus assembly protein PilF